MVNEEYVIEREKAYTMQKMKSLIFFNLILADISNPKVTEGQRRSGKVSCRLDEILVLEIRCEYKIGLFK